METKTKDITIEKPIQQIVTKVSEKYAIQTPAGMETASEMRVLLKSELKKITAHKELKTKPMLAALAAVRADYKPFETQIENAIEIINSAMSQYQTAEIKRAREEEAKIAARVGEGKGKLRIETAVQKIEDIDRPETRIATKAGATSFRTDKILKIPDMRKVREYIMKTNDWSFVKIDESMLKSVLLSGGTVPGAEIEEVQIPINR